MRGAVAIAASSRKKLPARHYHVWDPRKKGELSRVIQLPGVGWRLLACQTENFQIALLWLLVEWLIILKE